MALALDSGLATEAASRLQEYIQLRTSTSSKKHKALTSEQLDAAARMYALEVLPTRTSCMLHPAS